MKQALILATLLTGTGIGVAQLGGVLLRSAQAATDETSPPTKAHDPYSGQAAQRWRTCQPPHWRACLLQR